MSFVHHIRVGYFTDTPVRELQLEECVELIARFQAQVQPELSVEIVSEPRGSRERGFVLAYAYNRPILLRRGTLVLPILDTRFFLNSIALAICFHKELGCQIYSDDDGKFLTPEELIPDMPFSEMMRQVIKSENWEMPFAP